MITLKLKIENTYELYDDVTTFPTVTCPPPPADRDSEAYDEWKQQHIGGVCGVGNERGDAWYDVTVLESSHPDLVPVGTEYEFGY